MKLKLIMIFSQIFRLQKLMRNKIATESKNDDNFDL